MYVVIYNALFIILIHYFYGCASCAHLGSLFRECVRVCVREQAGDLYENIRNNQRALECYCKGGAFRKGKTQSGLSLSLHQGISRYTS